jgi:hypothetical protein
LHGPFDNQTHLSVPHAVDSQFGPRPFWKFEEDGSIFLEVYYLKCHATLKFQLNDFEKPLLWLQDQYHVQDLDQEDQKVWDYLMDMLRNVTQILELKDSVTL